MTYIVYIPYQKQYWSWVKVPVGHSVMEFIESVMHLINLLFLFFFFQEHKGLYGADWWPYRSVVTMYNNNIIIIVYT